MMVTLPGLPQLPRPELLRQLPVRAVKTAAAPSEYESDPSARRLRQTEHEQSYAEKLLGSPLIQAPMSALGYIGTQLDALLGRRVRAGISLVQGNRRPGVVSELFTVPVISDLAGWTNPRNAVTGKELIGWDDENTIWDGVAGFAVEMLTDPLSYTPGLLVGAMNRGGKLVKNAGMMTKVARGMSNKLGRRVGPREAIVTATMKEAVAISTGGPTDSRLMSAAMRERFDAAAKGLGYDGIDDALVRDGDRVLGGRIGLTWNPFGEARWTFGTGEISKKTLRLADQAAGYFRASRAGATLGRMFDSRLRDAESPAAQERLVEAYDELQRESFAVRLKNGERNARLTLLGLDNPEYRDAIRASVERSVRRTPEVGNDWYLAAPERDLDVIITDNLKRVGHPAADAPKQWEGYGEAREFLNGVWQDAADNLLRFRELGLGDKTLDSVREAYLHRATQPIADPKYYKRNPPTRITYDMRRALKAKGLHDSDIDKLSPEEALHKAYGVKVTAADRVRAEDLKRGPIEQTGDGAQRTVPTRDKTGRERDWFLRGIRGGKDSAGGTSALSMMSLDTRVSGPLADYANDPAAATRVVYNEYMGGDDDLLKLVNEEVAKRQAPGLPARGVSAAPFQPGQAWGALAGEGDIGAGKIATEMLTADDARKLNDWFVIEKAAQEQSEFIAEWLRGHDPRHAFHQVPLWRNDPSLDQMNFELATRRTDTMARSALHIAGDALNSKLERGQGPTVLAGLKDAGFEGTSRERLAAFIKHNADQFGQDEAFKASAAEDLRLLTEKNPHPKYLTPEEVKETGTRNMKVATGSGYRRVNPAWLTHRAKVATVFYKYGAKPRRLAKRGAVRAEYQALVDEAAKQVKKQSAELPGAPIHLREADFAALLRRAEAASLDVTPDTAASLADAAAYQRWKAGGGKPFRIEARAANDMQKAMSLAADPEVTRGFLAGWDKLTNTWKSYLTAQHLAFAFRNVQSMGLQDFVYGAGSQAGAASLLSPQYLMGFFRRWKQSMDFHAGKEIKDAHRLPLFSGTDWDALARDESRLTGARVANDEAFRRRAANEYLRRVAMAAEVAPPHRSGEAIADALGVHPESFTAISEMIPGAGRNVMGPAAAWAGMKGAAGDFARKLASGRLREIDWSFVNPAAVRGGFVSPPTSNTSDFLPAHLGEKGNAWAESVGRTATWLGFLRQGVDPVEAALRSAELHVDYSAFTNFERRNVKRWVPFYSFSKKMASFFLRDLARHPGGATANLIRLVNNTTGEGRSDRIVPQQLAGQLAIPLYKRGKVQAYLRPDLPVDVLNDMATIGPDGYTTFQNTVLGWLGMVHMLPKGVIETAFGKSTFQKGRNLEDLYSRIGVKDPLTNQIIMSSPISRYLTQFGPRGVAFDERKSLGEKAMSLVVGMPVQQLDMEKATDEVANEAIRRGLRTAEGVGRSERFYVNDDAAIGERERALLDLQNSVSRERARRNREVRKAREIATRDETQGGRFTLPRPTLFPAMPLGR